MYDKLLNDPRVRFLDEPPGLETMSRSLTQAFSPSQALWTDAYLAAFVIQTQSQLVTFDQGLSRFAGLDLFVL